MNALLTLLFNGVAYGVLLFVMAVGLSVTMGMMRFINLAHISLSMLGGYVLVTAMNAWGWHFFAALPLTFVATGVAAVVLERLVLRFFYDIGELMQVMLTLGLVFMSIAAVAYLWGPSFKPVEVPNWLSGQVQWGEFGLERYRLFLLVCGVIIVAAMVLGLERTRFGAMVRACVDNRRAAAGCGLDTDGVFALTFALGGGLAGLGGALSVNLLSLDPNFPLRYLTYVLIVVSLGGFGSILGSLLAAVLIGVADVLGKYYLPTVGGFFIYLLTIFVMMKRPHGLLGLKGAT